MTKEEAVNRFKGIKKSFSISIAQSKFYPSKVILDELCDMAIEALSADAITHEIRTETHECVSETHDLISRERTLRAINGYLETIPYIRNTLTDVGRRDATIHCLYIISELPSADDVQGWIPVKWHEITDEEREREGYPKDWTVYIDCEMPYDEQEILIQTKNGYIRWDVCYEDGEFSLDSGWDWVEDILAWMPLPKPYREDGKA